jgi:hypothetical protein
MVVVFQRTLGEVNASAPCHHHRLHDAKCVLEKEMYSPCNTISTYVLMIGECMHVGLFIKKVMNMHHVSIHPLVIIIKKYLATPTI